MVGLSSEQMELIRGAADGVPPLWRDRYLMQVLDNLLPNPAPNNQEVLQAVSKARRTLALGDRPRPPENPPLPHACGLRRTATRG
jgi:hypothetical protein